MAVSDVDREWLRQSNHHILQIGDDDYPKMLAGIDDAPQKIYVRGKTSALHLPALAIVGSRNPTRGGRQNAYEFARHLGSAGFCIVSGLAEGIDTSAHEGALHARGATIAFLGHGIDSVSPAANTSLAAEIARNGALCSEFPLGSKPRRHHFPQRNRLISGLSLGTLVVEAARRSGSLISARLAAEQGREVFAIPGSIHNPMSRGCHKLIRQGAKLVETAGDIVVELGPLVEHLMQKTGLGGTQAADVACDVTEYKLLMKALSYDPASIDELSIHSGLTIGQVSSMLLILELEGKVDAQAGGRYSRRP